MRFDGDFPTQQFYAPIGADIIAFWLAGCADLSAAWDVGTVVSAEGGYLRVQQTAMPSASIERWRPRSPCLMPWPSHRPDVDLSRRSTLALQRR